MAKKKKDRNVEPDQPSHFDQAFQDLNTGYDEDYIEHGIIHDDFGTASYDASGVFNTDQVEQESEPEPEFDPVSNYFGDEDEQEQSDSGQFDSGQFESGRYRGLRPDSNSAVYADPISNFDPRARHSEESMRKMYVKSDSNSGVAKIELRQPRKADEPSGNPYLKSVLILLLLGTLVVSGLMAVKAPMVDKQGIDRRFPLPVWIWKWFTMPPFQRDLQKYKGESRALILTNHNINLVYEAAARVVAARGPGALDSASQFVDDGSLQEHQTLDGWGYEFFVEPDDLWFEVRSPGKNGALFDDDDIVYNDSGLDIPIIYDQTLFEAQYRQF